MHAGNSHEVRPLPSQNSHRCVLDPFVQISLIVWPYFHHIQNRKRAAALSSTDVELLTLAISSSRWSFSTCILTCVGRLESRVVQSSVTQSNKSKFRPLPFQRIGRSAKEVIVRTSQLMACAVLAVIKYTCCMLFGSSRGRVQIIQSLC